MSVPPKFTDCWPPLTIVPLAVPPLYTVWPAPLAIRLPLVGAAARENLVAGGADGAADGAAAGRHELEAAVLDGDAARRAARDLLLGKEPLTSSPLATPPVPTIWVPNWPMVLALSVPPLKMVALPPSSIWSATPLPPAEICWKAPTPLMTVPRAWPPENTNCVPAATVLPLSVQPLRASWPPVIWPLTAVPPEDTVCRPPASMMTPLAVPPSNTNCCANAPLSVSPEATPPFDTFWVPKSLTVVPMSWPPPDRIWVPPDTSVPATAEVVPETPGNVLRAAAHQHAAGRAAVGHVLRCRRCRRCRRPPAPCRRTPPRSRR